MSLVNFSQNISPFGRKRDISQKCGTRVKNPIAKGVMVAHMLNDERQKTRLLEIFSSMTTIMELIMTADKK